MKIYRLMKILPPLILGGLLFFTPLYGGEIEDHWSRPIPPQGTPPVGLSPLEQSLNPEACKFCHKDQFSQWETTLHSKSISPGLLGQLLDMGRSRINIEACTRCHAPLYEQINEFLRGSVAESLVFPEKKGLFEKGVFCGVCHIRKNVKYGPPPKKEIKKGKLPHNGFEVAEWFQDSKFCSSCHQFPRNGFVLNGKLLVNTYNEWLESPFAGKDITCQSCHMPDRKHLWRGIHDKEMTEKGLEIDVKSTLKGDSIETTLTIKNSGVGHLFPTYVTPLVVARVFMVDNKGVMIKGTLKERKIGRYVPLNLSFEEFDTRIPPGGIFKVDYSRKIAEKAESVRVEVKIFPDEFYNRFYKQMIPYAVNGKALLEKALQNTIESRYVLYKKDIPLSKIN